MQLMPLSSLTAVWTAPIPVSVPGVVTRASTLDGPVLDTNIHNNGVAIWTSRGQDSIASSFYTFGIGWSTPEIISSQALIPIVGNPVFVAQGDPQISMNNFNYCVGVWEASEFISGPDTNIQGVYSATRDPAGTWSSVQRICNLDLDPGFFATNPSGALNDSGLAVAAWREQRTGDDDDLLDYVMANFLQEGGSWGTPVTIAGPIPAFFPNRDNTPDVQIDDVGNVIVSWVLVDAAFNVGATTYSATTNTWSAPVFLDPSPNAGAPGSILPRAAINKKDNGNSIVLWVWEDSTHTTSIVYSASFTNGVWGPATTVATNPAGSNFTDPYVVMDNLGNATAVWTINSIGNSQVQSSSLPFGGTWSAPVVVSTVSGENLIFSGLTQRPLSVNKNGDVMVIFKSVDDQFQPTVYTATKPFGQAWLAPEFVSNDATYPPDQIDARLLNVGIESCGFAISLWIAQNLVSESPFFRDYQVWASIHSTALVAPCNFNGRQCKVNFATQTVYANTLTWDDCNPGCIFAYNLYRNGLLIATIPGTGPFTFTDVVKRKNANTYCLTSISNVGEESPATCLKL